MSTTLSFQIKIAEHFQSADVAVVYEHILFWLRNNKCKGINQIEGRTWMYETCQQIADHFSYMTEKVVRNCVARLVEEGFLLEDHHASNKFNRTKWYAVPDEGLINKSLPTSRLGCSNLLKGEIPSSSLGCSEHPVLDVVVYKDKQEDKHNMLCSSPPVGAKVQKTFEIKAKDYKGNDISVKLDEIVLYAMKTKKDWTMPEMEEAFEAMVGTLKMTDPFKLAEGIIKRKRVNAHYEKKQDKINPKEDETPKVYPKNVKWDDVKITKENK